MLIIFLITQFGSKSFRHMGAPAQTNAQKYQHAHYACQILAYLYPRAANPFLVIYWNIDKTPAMTANSRINFSKWVEFCYPPILENNSDYHLIHCNNHTEVMMNGLD